MLPKIIRKDGPRGGQGRIYEVDGVDYPSVTTILGMLGKGDALLQWAVNCAIDRAIVAVAGGMEPNEALEAGRALWKEKRSSAANRGTMLHDLISNHIKESGGQSVELRRAIDHVRAENEEAYNGWLAFREWEASVNPSWLASEIPVYHDGSFTSYAGTIDAVFRATSGEHTGRVFLLDFKTSKAVYDEHKIQVSAYRTAYNDMVERWPDDLPERADSEAVLCLHPETAEPSFYDTTSGWERRVAFFNHLAQAWYNQRERKLKGNRHAEFVKRIRGEN
jgi:hypothetical protein